LTLAGALAGAYALPLMRRAFLMVRHLGVPTVSPPLDAEASQEAAAREGAPRAKIRQQASRPVRPTMKLRMNELWVSGDEGKMPISFFVPTGLADGLALREQRSHQ